MLSIIGLGTSSGQFRYLSLSEKHIFMKNYFIASVSIVLVSTMAVLSKPVKEILVPSASVDSEGRIIIPIKGVRASSEAKVYFAVQVDHGIISKIFKLKNIDEKSVELILKNDKSFHLEKKKGYLHKVNIIAF